MYSLGGGKARLDCPLEEARQTHRLTEADAPPPGGTAVGSFLGKGGKNILTLWRLAPAGPGGSDPGAGPGETSEPASLEDVVLGYLAAGRGAGLQLN